MWYEFARYFIWLLAIFALLIALWRGLLRHTSDSPFFVAYIAAAFVQTSWGLLLHHWFYPVYARLYWPSQALLVAFAFAALYEVLSAVLIRHPSISCLGGRLTLGGAVMLGVIAVVWLGSLKRSSMTDTILAFEQALRLVQVGVLMLALILATFFRLRWSHCAFGIALGFGLYGIFNLIAIELLRQDLLSKNAFILLDPFAYDCVVMIWLAYLFQPQPELIIPALPHHDLHHWNAALGELLER